MVTKEKAGQVYLYGKQTLSMVKKQQQQQQKKTKHTDKGII